MVYCFLVIPQHTLKADKSLVNQGLDLHLTDGLAWERANSPGAGPDMKDRLANFGKK